MSYTLYDGSIGVAKEVLQSLQTILKKAEASPNSAKFAEARLAENMLPLSFQVHMVTDTAQKLFARTSGTEPIQLERDTLTDFAAFYARIEQVQAIVNKADKDTVNKRGSETVTIGMGGGKNADMASSAYVSGYVVPNLFFHLSIAYAILRKEGVDLGKMDYLSSFIGKHVSL